MPRQLTFDEVKEDVTKGLKIISSSLFYPQMCVHRRVTSCACQVFSIAVRDMLSCFGVPEPLGKTKINYVNIVLFLPNANQKVVRLDVSVEKVPRVDELDAL